MEVLKTATAGLAATHTLWAASLLLDGTRYVYEPVIPPLFALAHVLVALLLFTDHRVSGNLVATPILTYYWLFVKPHEPIAEPQTVGILGVTAALLIKELGPGWDGFWQVVLRMGVAYPFVEWGLDAFRNPFHFKAYLMVNPVTSRILPAEYFDFVVFVLGIYELLLACLVVSGLFRRVVAVTAASTLLFFMAVAGYPLAFPQNIALVAAAPLLSSHSLKFQVCVKLPRLE